LDSWPKEGIEGVLKECKGVFEEPKDYWRGIDHKISMKKGVEAVNVRPYRYPFLLKSQIEKQVAEMLKAGIIQPSKWQMEILCRL